MSVTTSHVSKKSKRGFQTQKIYVQKFGKVANQDIPILEKQMAEYFSMFGLVIDKKILENGMIIRLQGLVCDHHVRRRRASFGSAKQKPLLQ